MLIHHKWNSGQCLVVINFVQYNKNPRNYYKLDVKALELKKHRKIYDRLKEEDRQIIGIAFGNSTVM